MKAIEKGKIETGSFFLFFFFGLTACGILVRLTDGTVPNKCDQFRHEIFGFHPSPKILCTVLQWTKKKKKEQFLILLFFHVGSS